MIEYLREEKPLGTGGALSLLPEVPADPMLVLNGDLLTQFDVGSLLAFHASGKYRATVGVHEYTHTVPFSHRSGQRIEPRRRWPRTRGVRPSGAVAIGASSAIGQAYYQAFRNNKDLHERSC